MFTNYIAWLDHQEAVLELCHVWNSTVCLLYNYANFFVFLQRPSSSCHILKTFVSTRIFKQVLLSLESLSSVIFVLQWHSEHCGLSVEKNMVNLPEHIWAEPVAFKITKITMYVLILVLSTVGNSAVIVVVCRSKRRRSVAGNLLILNLALCDLLTPLLSIPFDLALEENSYKWLYGEAMCTLLAPAATLTSTGSSLTLAAISLNRYRALMHPFKTRLTLLQVKILIATVYVFSTVSAIPYALVQTLNSNFVCTEVWPTLAFRQAYTVYLFLIQYAFPLLFMAVMYVRALFTLFATSRWIRSRSFISQGDETAPRTSSSSSSHASLTRVSTNTGKTKSDTRAYENNLKVTKMFILIVIVFAVCMLPNEVRWLWVDLGSGHNYKNIAMITIICQFFTYANSCLNPVIFYKFSADFSDGFKKIFKGVACVQARSTMMGLQRPNAGTTRVLGSAKTCNASTAKLAPAGARADLTDIVKPRSKAFGTLGLHSSLTDSAISSKDVQIGLEGTSKNVCEQYKAECDRETTVAQSLGLIHESKKQSGTPFAEESASSNSTVRIKQFNEEVIKIDNTQLLLLANLPHTDC